MRSWRIWALAAAGVAAAAGAIGVHDSTGDLRAPGPGPATTGPMPPVAAVAAVAGRVAALHARNLRELEAAAAFHARLPATAQRRFAAVRASYAQRHQEILSALERAATGGGSLAGDLSRVKRAIQGSSRGPHPAHRGNLSGPQPFPRLREPRASEAEWRAGEPLGDAATPGGVEGWIAELFAPRTAWAEEPIADLAPTPEVVMSAEIVDLAVNTLKRSPARIASWVRRNIELAPVHGALQTSETCLRNRRGTAADIASLTIALLRAAGIPARYRAGTVRVPIEAAKAWLGEFTDADAAASLLATGGTPALVELGRDGRPAFLRFEHVWVAAFVDFVPVRGACPGPGDTWVPIDTAIKTRVAGPVINPADLLDDAPGDGAFDAGQLLSRLEAYLATAERDPDSGALRGIDLDGLEGFLGERADAALDLLLAAHGSASMDDLAGRSRASDRDNGFLAASPPFITLALGWERTDLPDDLRWRIKLRLQASGSDAVLEHQLTAPDLGSSRFAVAYGPGDGALEVLSPQLTTRPGEALFETIQVAGVEVVPRLLRDGVAIPLEAPARPVLMGAALEIVVDLVSPTLSTEPMRAAHTAGAVTAIAIDLIAVPDELFAKLGAEMEMLQEVLAGREEPGDGARALEALLSAPAHGWFRTLDLLGSIAAGAMGCVVERLPSAGVVSASLAARDVFGIPLSVSQGGLSVDIPADRVALIARDGNDATAARAGIARGFIASALESLAPAELFHDESAPEHWLSSAGALRQAARNGDGIALVEPGSGAGAALGALRLPAHDIATIRDALDRGLVVFTHTTPFRGRSGVHAGYAILDPLTGGGSYRVSSGTNGGESVECSSCAAQGPCCNSPQGCNGPLDFFLRFWSGQFQDNLFSDLVDALPDGVSDAIQAVTAVIDEYTKNANIMDSALQSVPADQRETLRPLVGMVILLTGLKAVSDHLCPDFASFACEEYISIVQGTAWRGVRNVLLYRARTDLAVEGIDMPFDCLEQLIEENDE